MDREAHRQTGRLLLAVGRRAYRWSRFVRFLGLAFTIEERLVSDAEIIVKCKCDWVGPQSALLGGPSNTQYKYCPNCGRLFTAFPMPVNQKTTLGRSA